VSVITPCRHAAERTYVPVQRSERSTFPHTIGRVHIIGQCDLHVEVLSMTYPIWPLNMARPNTVPVKRPGEPGHTHRLQSVSHRQHFLPIFPVPLRVFLPVPLGGTGYKGLSVLYRYLHFADRLRAGAGRRSGSGRRQGRVCWGRPLLSRPRGARAVGRFGLAAPVESAAASVVALTCGVCVVGGFGWL
jgi:hypothetical protein